MQISIWTPSSIPCWSFSDAQVKKLKRAIVKAEIIHCQHADQLKETLPDSDIVIANIFNQQWFDLAPRLKWLAVPSAGKDYFSITPPAGLLVTHGSFQGEIMAETVVGMILACCRGILFAKEIQSQKTWQRGEIAAKIRLLRGSHVVIVGFGHIGNLIARRLKPFGVKITGIKRKMIEKPPFFTEQDQIVTLDQLDNIVPLADHLVFVLPRETSTNLLLNRKRLALIDKNAYLYNVGRGNLIDERALAEILKKGKIAGVCLDVFQTEPLPADSPLWECPNILLLPHVSAVGEDYLDMFIEEFVAQYYQLF